MSEQPQPHASFTDRIIPAYAPDVPWVRAAIASILREVAAAASKRTVVDLAEAVADLARERDLAIATRNRAQAEATAAVLARRDAERQLTAFILAVSDRQYAGQPCAMGKWCPGYQTQDGVRFHPPGASS